ncbi:trypsin-1-like [Neocloeon triangulifer]|uniref:trypsin-1-like n=1 Tax=Neocloeon triangulifer TaxID=2078957 RepID=UPI00286EC1CB|nr:trypsin-1-like [Neocloeon triangulifer]
MYSKVVIVLACAALALGGVHKLTGPQLFKAGDKIVGGSPAAAGEIPWQVSLQYTSGFHFCGGSIISETYILTAAHCSTGQTPNGVRVITGTLRTAQPGATYNVATININPDYSSSTFTGDIALWEIRGQIAFDANTAAVPLAQGKAADGTPTLVSGWGTTSAGGSASPVLLRVVVPIYNHAQCESDYAGFGGVPQDQICAGVPEGGVDSCQGDSGGPLYFDGVIHGIVSWGNGCAYAGYPGVYTEVFSWLGWINQVSGV